MLTYETDVTATVDPFAGSYVMESLTDEIESEILRLMQFVEDAGGAVAAIERGLQKAEIERSAYDVARSIDDGERVIVGVNRFTIDEASRSDMLRVDPAIEDHQVERLERLRATRDGAEVERCLAGVRAAAEGSGNTLPAIRLRWRNSPPWVRSVMPSVRLGHLCPGRRVLETFRRARRRAKAVSHGPNLDHRRRGRRRGACCASPSSCDARPAATTAIGSAQARRIATTWAADAGTDLVHPTPGQPGTVDTSPGATE